MGRAGLEPALLQQELGPKPSAYANFATCPCILIKIQLDLLPFQFALFSLNETKKHLLDKR
jgi:hypothetical protein